MQSRITVVMATYQGERFIADQLASLAAQTRKPDSLLISDDGSTDATLAVAESFAMSAPFRVAIQRNPARLGYAWNFIAAARRADGDIVCFADQDDVWHPEKLAAMGAALEDGRDLAVGHDIGLVDAGGGAILPSYFARLRADGLPASLCIKGCSLGFRRELVAAWGWPEPDSGISHDLWIASLALAAGRRGVLDRVLVSHRLHGANASGWFVRREDLHLARRVLRGLAPRRRWTELDAFLECYFPLDRVGGPVEIAQRIAHRPALGDAAALARFRRAAAIHRLFIRHYPGMRDRRAQVHRSPPAR
jgi:glycosyltransferase involved in cell wall biosynthesis